MNSAVHRGLARTRLRVFVLGSLILHGAALAGWQTSPWVTGQTESVLTVMLEPSKTQAAKAEIRSSRRQAHYINSHEGSASGASKPQDAQIARLATSAGIQHTSNVSLQGRYPLQENNNDDAQGSPARAPNASGNEIAHDQAMAQIRAHLLTELGRYFDYPAYARQHGWQGRVLLGFRVESNGHIERVHVTNSSGYAILDNSALNSLTQVSHLAEAVVWLNGKGIDMQLPVIYRLIEN